MNHRRRCSAVPWVKESGTQQSDLEGLLAALLSGSPAAPQTRSVPPAAAEELAGEPPAGLAGDPLLQNLLDTNGDGDVDMADLIRLGSKFFK